MLTDGKRLFWHPHGMERHMVLKRARDRAGLSQRQVADRVGISFGYVGQLETPLGNAKNLSSDKLWLLASTLKIPVQDLFTENGDSTADPFTLTDLDEVEMVSLFRKFHPRQKAAHLAVFRSTVPVPDPGEAETLHQEHDPSGGSGITSIRAGKKAGNSD